MILYNEINPIKADALRYLIDAGVLPQGDVDERSISELPFDFVAQYSTFHAFAGVGVWAYALRIAGWPDDRPVWTASPPCQPFSKAGLRLATDDQRHLFPDWFRHVERCRPPVTFLEQVSSIDTIGPVQFENTGRIEPETEWPWFCHVQRAFEEALYAVGSRSFPASSVGAPHPRTRLYAVAYSCSKGLEGRFEHGDGTGQRSTGQGGLGTPASGGITNGFWSDAQPVAGIYGSDRLVESGTFPLVDGATRHLGCGADPREPTQEARRARIESYGDAIVAQQAAIWIQAYMDSTG